MNSFLLEERFFFALPACLPHCDSLRALDGRRSWVIEQLIGFSAFLQLDIATFSSSLLLKREAGPPGLRELITEIIPYKGAEKNEANLATII